MKRRFCLFKEACKQLAPDYFMDDVKALINDAFKKGAAHIHISPD